MNNKKIILIVIILSGLVALIIKNHLSHSSSTITSSEAQFNIDDTASITQVFIADSKGNQVTIQRVDENSWQFPNGNKVNQHTVNILLETVKLMRIKSPVSKARYDKTIRDLSTIATKVEFYTGSDTPSKVIYVGTPNQTHTGNYMMIENSSLPYLVHIEGFNGFLSPRFSPFENDWKVKTIFNSDPSMISEIKLSFPNQPAKNWVIKKGITGVFELYNGLEVPEKNWDTGYVVDYLERFRNINFEGWEETKTPIFIDSVRNSTPLEIYSVTTLDGKTTTVKTFKKPLASGLDIEGNPIDHDQDRMYATINDDEFVIIQYFVFDPLNHGIDYFFK